VNAGRGRGVQRAGFIAIWILGGIAQQVQRDARAGVLNAKSLWRHWMTEYWPRVPAPVRAPFFAVGVSARAVYRAGHQAGRTVYIGACNGVEEGHHRYRERREFLNLPIEPGSEYHFWQRVSRERRERADTYRMYGEQVHGAAIQRREEKNRWSSARSLADLGELTAQWAEGTIRYKPGSYSNGPDPETLEIASALAALNRSGFVTYGSQPGEFWTSDDGWVRHQRAEVSGFTDQANADRLEKLCTEAGLLFIRNGPAGWRTSWKNNVVASASPIGGDDLPEDARSLRDPRYHAECDAGVHLSRLSVQQLFDGCGTDALVTAEQVTIIDPEWGRKDHLWQTLVGDAHVPTGDDHDDAVEDPEEPQQPNLPILTSGLPHINSSEEPPGTDALGDVCRSCQRPESEHCARCGTCWPDHTCAIECDVNASHNELAAEGPWDLVPAENLQPGQMILVGAGNVQTVAAPTEFDEYGGVAIHTDQSTILTQLPAPVKVLGNANNNGGNTMTAPTNTPTPTPTTAGGDITTIPALERAYDAAEPAMAVAKDVQTAAAADYRAQAANLEAAAAQIAADGHDEATVTETYAAMSAMLDAAARAEEAAAAADAALAAMHGAKTGIRRHDALREAVNSHAGHAHTDAFRES
jgi:uncharacterized protein DUF6919